MLKFCRVVLLVIFGLIAFIPALIICLIRPFKPINTYLVSHYLIAKAIYFTGLKLHFDFSKENHKHKSAIYAANHQSNWDIAVLAPSFQPGVITIGKKSLMRVPLFGIIYFLAGNVGLDRENKQKAIETMNKVSEDLRDGKHSIWIFPEGTRSKGKGLGKFKPGAIFSAIESQVPIVPIVASNYIKTFDLNRWNNGHVFIKVLDPIYYPDIDVKSKEGIKEIRKKTQELQDLFSQEIAKLDALAEEYNRKDGLKLISKDLDQTASVVDGKNEAVTKTVANEDSSEQVKVNTTTVSEEDKVKEASQPKS